MAEIKRQYQVEFVEQLEFLHSIGGDTSWATTVETVLAKSTKYLLCPSSLHLGMNLTEIHMNTHENKSTRIYCGIFIHTILHSMKMNILKLCAITWVTVVNTMLNKARLQRVHHVSFHLYKFQRETKCHGF